MIRSCEIPKSFANHRIIKVKLFETSEICVSIDQIYPHLMSGQPKSCLLRELTILRAQNRKPIHPEHLKCRNVSSCFEVIVNGNVFQMNFIPPYPLMQLISGMILYTSSDVDIFRQQIRPELNPFLDYVDVIYQGIN